MKQLLLFATLLLSTAALAQKQDSTARTVIEKGEKAEKHLRKEIQQKSLTREPQRLQPDQPNQKPAKKKKSCARKND